MCGSLALKTMNKRGKCIPYTSGSVKSSCLSTRFRLQNLNYKSVNFIGTEKTKTTNSKIDVKITMNR